MIRPRAERTRAALEPVRSELLRQARTDAARARADAEADARRTRESAAAQAREVVDRARAQGHAQAEAAAEANRVRARRAGRAEELAARRAAHDELRTVAVEAVRLRLRDGPGYPALRETLTEVARRQLGPEADVREDPGGGVVATADGRRLDLTLATLTGRACDGLGAELDGLWSV
ncbi:hypothetical protein [Myceligenerans indicum]|uniref:V-type ATP synthase subunit E n=1 Tax=Myceligenerans indicum TaxID=2593663 RepID=A0ABS1LGR4_9MICO|nr:hypothetical protein [Myceligenerans indicum]MBL0885410.1 hypothetical protein [Myceligenerans indicum]